MSFLKRSVSLLIALAMLTAIIAVNTFPASAAFPGVLQFNEAGKFRIIQLADIQDSANINSRTIALITNAMVRYQPDLVVFTGDNLITTSSNFQATVNQFTQPLIDNSIKFAVTFGNHDEDSTAPNKTTQYNYYKTRGGNLFVDHDVEALTGVGNGVMPIYPNGQTDGAPAYQVYLMDSGASLGISIYPSGLRYDNPRTDQIDYYIQRSIAYPTVPSLWFQHIIVPDVFWQTMTTTNNGTPGQRGNGSLFGNNTWYLKPEHINWAKSGQETTIANIYKELPCPPRENDYTATIRRSSPSYGSKTLYESWRDYGNMRGAYFGHDHKNSFVMTTPHGIDLGYGKAATLSAYNDGNPGFRVFDLDVSGTYSTHNVTEADLVKAQVFFDANGGAGELIPQFITKNSTAALRQNTYTKTGATFLGWATSPTGEVLYADGTNFTIGNNDVTLYAKWTNPVNITFNANGGNGGTGPIVLQSGSALTAPTVSRTGYTFAGWSPSVPSTVPETDTTYTAQWTANTYTINYIGNGSSSGNTESSVHTYDAAKYLTANGYFKVGHSFLGWSMSPSANTPAYVDTQSVLNLTATSNDVLTFYAVWQINSYTMTFDADGGEGSLQVAMNFGESLTPPTVTREGYTFVGWSPEVPSTVPDSDSIYTAVWAAASPVLTPNDQTNTVIDQATGFIFGLNPGTTQAVFENSLVTVGGNGRLVITPTTAGFGTGTKVELLNNEDDAVIAVYYILIFGDATGDGSIDGNDFGRIIDVMNWLHTWDPEILSLMILAADLNGDGVIDGVDADILVEVENWNMDIDQVTGLAGVLIN